MNRDRAGIIAPPPLLTLVAIIAGLAADRFHRLPWIPAGSGALRIIAAAVPALFAAVLLVAAKRELSRHATTVNPYRPSTAVVSTGIYRLTRNPIYVGLMLVVVAVAAGANTLWVFVMLGPLFLLLHFGVVKREERYLSGKFGVEYERYRGTTRRWLI